MIARTNYFGYINPKSFPGLGFRIYMVAKSGDGTIHLSAITSGGSQAMFFKINTFGEQAFLDKLEQLL